MKTIISDVFLDIFLEVYFFDELDAGHRLHKTRLYQHIDGKIDLLPEIQSVYKIDEETAKNLIHLAHEQIR